MRFIITLSFCILLTSIQQSVATKPRYKKVCDGICTIKDLKGKDM